MVNKEGSLWFRRLVKDCKKISRHIRIKRIKLGFYRIYWDRAYIHEVYKEMPQIGYNVEEKNEYLVNKKYFEEYEDRTEMTRKIKNYIEGYWDSLDRIRTRAWLMRHDKEFHENAVKAYSQHVIK